MAWPYPPAQDDGRARHLPGIALPALSLPSTRGAAVNLHAWPRRVAVFIYPWTGQPGLPNPPDWDHIPGAHGSTPQAQGFADRYGDYLSAGFDVFGLSSQSTAYQLEFAARTGLPFALLSDADFAFADALRLPSFETGGVRYLKRLTLVVEHGHISRVFYPVHPPDTHAADVLAALGA